MFFIEKQKGFNIIFLNSFTSWVLSEFKKIILRWFLQMFRALVLFFLIYLSLNFAGGYREVEIPSPIPNLEVKHFIADNTAGSPGGNVGRCQLLSFYKA